MNQSNAADNVIYLHPESKQEHLRVISVTSGKGGVGKTNIVTNIGMSLARKGYRVLIIDADLGLANVDVLLGLSPRYNLYHVIEEGIPINDVLVKSRHGLTLLPASSGKQTLTNLTDNQKWMLLGELETLGDQFDIVLIDTAAGISNNVLYFASAAQDVIVVVNNEPTSMTDAYALIKVLSRKCGVKEFNLLINEVDDEKEAKQVFSQLSSVTSQFLNVTLNYLSHVFRDENVNRAVLNQRPFVEALPYSPASKCIQDVSQKLVGGDQSQSPSMGGLKLFWKKLFFRNEEQ